MKHIIIVDIDGTVSKVGDRLKYLEMSPPDWDMFYNSCFEDEPIEEMLTLVEDLDATGNEIIFCTGRRESVREETTKWLEEYLPTLFAFETPKILMRPNGDYRHDVEVKPESLEKAGIKLEEIAFVLEDRNTMVIKWRELGLRCLQVAPGDF